MDEHAACKRRPHYLRGACNESLRNVRNERRSHRTDERTSVRTKLCGQCKLLGFVRRKLNIATTRRYIGLLLLLTELRRKHEREWRSLLRSVDRKATSGLAAYQHWKLGLINYGNGFHCCLEKKKGLLSLVMTLLRIRLAFESMNRRNAEKRKTESIDTSIVTCHAFLPRC